MDEKDFRHNHHTALLLDAANLLERRAECCVPGSWVSEGRAVGVEGDPDTDIALGCPSHDEADWIAMMDPRLAPFLAQHMRERGRELYLNESMAGGPQITREYTQDAYGDILNVAVKILKRAEIPWSDLGDA